MKQRLDHKNEEKKLQVRDDFLDPDNDVPEEVIIDEEELNYLREMKDLKKAYKEDYDKLKNLKVDVQDLQ